MDRRLAAMFLLLIFMAAFPMMETAVAHVANAWAFVLMLEQIKEQ